MKIQTLSMADLSNKKILLRADFNVPLDQGKISDDTRITATIPTIKYLIEKGAKVILLSHLGRPQEDGKKGLELNPVAEKLTELLGHPVKKLDTCLGTEAMTDVENMKNGDVILLENTRFYPEEEQNDADFAKQLAGLADLFIIDSFGTAHRKHASTYGVSQYLPTYAGLLMEKEITVLSDLMKDTDHPLTLVMGGAKIDTKIGLIQNFIAGADYILLGGGIANTFLAAQGFDVADSLYEKDKIDLARELLLSAETLQSTFAVPEDSIVADEITNDSPTLDLPVQDVEGKMKILDIGAKTVASYIEIIAKSKTIIWNGPMGLFEKEPFANGTKLIAKAIAANKSAKTIIGGGDTIEAIKKYGIDPSEFTHVSTGGGAMLQFLEGTELPGVKIVMQ